MGLNSALTQLNGDRSLESVIRDVLVFFRTHPHALFSAAEVARRTARPVHVVERILLTLGRSFVLDSQSDPSSYRYEPDALLELDVERFLRRVGTIEGRLQNNVARFRERHDHS